MAEFWEYDPRLGRRWNLDPKTNLSFSSYATFANNPICFSDQLGDTTSYSVQKGDNLTNIAKQHNVSLDRLKEYNPKIKDFNKISVGQNINIPSAQNDELMNGDFAAVVNAPNGAAGFGHNALMVGNDKTGWILISKEGRQEGASATSGNNPISGGPALSPKEAKFGTIQDLLESSYFEEYKRVAAYTIKSSDVVPLITNMRSEAVSKYVLATNNCGHACANTVKTVGLDPGYIKYQFSNSLDIPTYSEGYMLSVKPNVMYQQMIKNNPTRLKTTVNE